MVLATEESKGGLKYELRLAKPSTTESPIKRPTTPPKSISAEDIQKKLKEAEERRQSLEAQKLNTLNEKMSRLAEVNQKKEGSVLEFQEAARQNYEKKIEAFKENREAHIKSIQDKQREHVTRVEEVRKSLDTNTQEMLASIQKKIENASEAREAQIGALQERLRNHDKHISDVRKQLGDLAEEKREKLQKKLESAQENRAVIYKELQAKLQEKVGPLGMASATREKSIRALKDGVSRQVIESYDVKRSSLATYVKVEADEKHAEEVRQNKVQTTEEKASSG
ncbi:unnamed protein product [Ixodes persulcatus]